MGKIRILPEILVNQIAAGEVIERPASVVRELVDNSIDADANRIEIEVRGSGRELIRVTDDGTGLSRDDMLLAFERHATSKLQEASGLFQISSLGFRGEALPSISSVSEVEFISRERGSARGHRLRIVGGDGSQHAGRSRSGGRHQGSTQETAPGDVRAGGIGVHHIPISG